MSCHELVRESMDVEQEKEKFTTTVIPYWTSNEVHSHHKNFKIFFLFWTTNNTLKTNDFHFVIEDVKKDHKKSTTINSNLLTVEVLSLGKEKKLRRQRVNRE